MSGRSGQDFSAAVVEVGGFADVTATAAQSRLLVSGSKVAEKGGGSRPDDAVDLVISGKHIEDSDRRRPANDRVFARAMWSAFHASLDAYLKDYTVGGRRLGT